MTDNDELKAKMREALDKKKSGTHGAGQGGAATEKAHGPEVANSGRRLHRRKSG